MGLLPEAEILTIKDAIKAEMDEAVKFVRNLLSQIRLDIYEDNYTQADYPFTA